MLDELTVTDLTLNCSGKTTTCTIAETARVQNAFSEYGATGTIKLVNNGVISPYGLKIYGSKAKVTVENNGLIEGADRGLELEDKLYAKFKVTAAGSRSIVLISPILRLT